MQAILFDMDGVRYVGDRPIDGPAEILGRGRRRAVPFRFATHTTARLRVARITWAARDAWVALLEKPRGMGIKASAEERGGPADRAWRIGDDGRKAIDGARQTGPRAAQLRTGQRRPEDLERGRSPDGVIDSIADWPAWWPHESCR